MARKRLKSIYKHIVDVIPLKITNSTRDDFAQKLIDIPYRGYEVEQVSDGRTIIITKPGGKRNFDRIAKEDILVFIHNPSDSTVWLISHPQILDDLKLKAETNPEATLEILMALTEVYEGKEPDDVLKNYTLQTPTGELPETLIKAYKWIWGQEDVNYPTKLGRRMSYEGWKSDGKGGFIKTGDGILDLINRLKG